MFDVSYLPTGEVGWRNLLDHAVKTGDAAEAEYLELKGPLDLSQKSQSAKVAKFLLGAANRDPEMAARNLQGHAVLIVGVLDGKAEGIPKGIEHHELANTLKRYLGEDFPGFDLLRLPAEKGREVMLIIGFPPKKGQLIFPCYATLDSETKNKRPILRRGEIYVRSSSETRVAEPEDIKMLSQRAQQSTRKPVKLELSGLGPVHRLPDLDEVITRLYDFEERRYREHYLDNHHNNSVKALSPLINLNVANVLGLESSTTRQREDRLRHWQEGREASEAEAREHFLGVLMGGFSFEVLSPGRSIEEPHLEIRLQDCEAVAFIGDDEPVWKDFVESVNEPIDPLVSRINPWTSGPLRHRDYPMAWEQDGDAVVIQLKLDSLRPDSPWKAGDDDLVVMTRGSEAESVTVSWKLTERGNDDPVTGKQQAKIQPPKDALEIFNDKVLSRNA